MAFLPQFVSPSEAIVPQLVVLGSICVVLNTLVDVVAGLPPIVCSSRVLPEQRVHGCSPARPESRWWVWVRFWCSLGENHRTESTKSGNSADFLQQPFERCHSVTYATPLLRSVGHAYTNTKTHIPTRTDFIPSCVTAALPPSSAEG